MAKELTFSEATLGWRFAHTEIFLKNFIKQWELLQDVQIKNLDEYWNLDAATGAWLNQLGEIYDTVRVQTLGEDAFMLNVSKLNDSESKLNGTIEDVADDLFRKIILIRSLSINKLFSMKNIAETLYEVFGEDNIRVEFRENTDSLGNYQPQHFRVLLTFKNSDMIRMFNGIEKTHPMLFIGKPMGVSYHVYVSYDPDIGHPDGFACCDSAYASDIWPSYRGTDDTINDTAHAYSFDNTHYTMYLGKNVTINANEWTALYATPEMTTVAAYIRNPVPYAPIAIGIENYYLINGGEVYFPLLGETESDARPCSVCRAKR